MSIDELRRGFDRLTAEVVPAEDPYGRVLRRARRTRLGRRLGAGVLAGLTALVLAAVGGTALQAASGREDKGGHGFDGWLITTEWTRALLVGPTRGPGANDAALLTDVAEMTQANANPLLPQTTVLWVGEISRGKVLAVVARYSATHAVFDALLRPSAADGWSGMLNAPVTPFLEVDSGSVGDDGPPWHLLLAPASCQLATRSGSGVDWTPAQQPDLVVTSPQTPAARVTCDGKVHQQGVSVPESLDVGQVSPSGQAANAFNELGGLLWQPDPANPRPIVSWEGAIPGVGAAALAFASTTPDQPALLLLPSASGKALPATGPADATVPRDEGPAANQSGREAFGLVATSAGVGHGLAAVRVPAHFGAFGVVTKQLFVYAPTAVRVEALTSAGTVVTGVDLSAEAGLLTLDLGGAASLRALAADGTVVGTRQLVEQVGGRQLFGEQLIDAW